MDIQAWNREGVFHKDAPAGGKEINIVLTSIQCPYERQKLLLSAA